MPRTDLASIRLEDEADTRRLGRVLAGGLVPGDTVLLEGALGAGKTVLARSILRSLAGDAELTVPSPTYTLAQTYELPLGTAHHFDFFRLENPSECDELGLDDVFGTDLALIEWPERLGRRLPSDWIRLRLKTAGRTGARTAELTVDGPEELRCRVGAAIGPLLREAA